MYKEIHYNSVASKPVADLAQNGQLDVALNAIYRDGAMRPLPKPAVEATLPDGYELMFIHHASGKTNYIGRSGGKLTVYYNGMNSDPIQLEVTPTGDITAIGNTLIVPTGDGINYVLFADGGYKALGTKPPFTTIRFGLQADHVEQSCSNSHSHLHVSFGGSKDNTGSLTTQNFVDVNNFVFGIINSMEHTQSSRGFFVYPFQIRYAYRMYDGSYLMHSTPVLMLPKLTNPMVAVWTDENGRNASSNAWVSAFRLMYSICDVSAELAEWKDLISDIDIFVSSPIYPYDSNAHFKDERGVVDYKCTPQEYFKKYRRFLDGNRADGNFFVGQYSDKIYTNGVESYTDFIEQQWNPNKVDEEMVMTRPGDLWTIRDNPMFEEQLRNQSVFYKIAEIKFEDIAVNTEIKDLELWRKDMTDLLTRPTLPDDYDSHATILPKFTKVYNSRLTIGCLEYYPAQPLPMDSATPYLSGDSTNVEVKVYTKVNRQSLVTTSHSTIHGNLVDTFPRYIYYPDANAYKMIIRSTTTAGSVVYTFDLKRHDFLNGAYYCGGLKVDSHPTSDGQINIGPEQAPQTQESIHLPSQLRTSDPANPFVFRATNVTSVGNDALIAIETAARPLSQGQFGQFPMYAFTDGGIWALTVGGDGAFVAAQPINRDVCNNVESITQLDNAVIYSTARGIMLLSGADTQCLTTVLDNHSFNTEVIKGISGWFDASRTCLGTLDFHSELPLVMLPFKEFIKGCRIVYDYTHQLIVIFNPSADVRYAYVYSLESQSWGMQSINLVYGVPSYPDALVVDADNNLCNLSEDSGEFLQSLIITRPMTLDAPDIYKVLSTIKHHGDINPAKTTTLILGANRIDNASWIPLVAYGGQAFQAFRTSAVKFARIALLTRFEDSQHISSTSIEITPKLIGKLR